MINPYSVDHTPATMMWRLANRLKALRKSQKLTQANLAERAGMSLGSLKRFEQTGQISLESLLNIAHVLDRLNDFKSIFEIDEELIKAERLFSDSMRRS